MPWPARISFHSAATAVFRDRPGARNSGSVPASSHRSDPQRLNLHRHQRRQHQVFDGRYLDVDLNNPDFLTYAAAFGVPGHRATTAAELTESLRIALAHGGPSLIEVPDSWRCLRVTWPSRERVRGTPCRHQAIFRESAREGSFRILRSKIASARLLPRDEV